MDYHDDLERTRAVGKTQLQPIPFRPRSEISADARYIVKHLWIICVALPLIVVVLSLLPRILR